MNIEECYRILGITPSSSLDDIRLAYRDLAQVWHPDKYEHNPRLREKAERQLKQINAAHDILIQFLNRQEGREQSERQQGKARREQEQRAEREQREQEQKEKEREEQERTERAHKESEDGQRKQSPETEQVRGIIRTIDGLPQGIQLLIAAVMLFFGGLVLSSLLDLFRK